MKRQDLKQLKVNFLPEHHRQLSELAAKAGVTKAQWIRKQLRATFENPREPVFKREYKKTDPELLYHLNKIGNNLNQIAKYLNSGGDLNNQTLVTLLQIESSLKDFL